MRSGTDVCLFVDALFVVSVRSSLTREDSFVAELHPSFSERGLMVCVNRQPGHSGRHFSAALQIASRGPYKVNPP